MLPLHELNDFRSTIAMDLNLPGHGSFGSKPATMSPTSRAIRSSPSQSCKSRRTGRRPRSAAAMIAMTALLLSSTSQSSMAEHVVVPDGLLFASDMGPSMSSDNEALLRGPSSSNEESIFSKTQPEIQRRHPIHRIYKDNAHIRRRVEEVENASPYYQTGIHGDPNHKLEYKNHPFDRLIREREMKAQGKHGEHLGEEEETKRRALQEEEETNVFQPIRIHFDNSALDMQLTSRNAKQIDFVKNTILPRTRDYWSSALSVVPVQDNLLISTSELQGRLYCGDTEFSKVPAEHIATGVPNADLVLYVSGAPSARFCGPSTLAVAVACNFDQFDRPTAGAINFCLDQIDLDDEGKASESVTQDNVDVAVHEAAHVLGMSSNSYRFFWDPDVGEVRTDRPFDFTVERCVDGAERELILPNPNTMKFGISPLGMRYASIVTPKVAAIARNQFDCQGLDGAQLENQPTGENSCTGDHWDERMFYPEALSGVISPTTNVLSPVTLALLEDSGWYKANYTRAHVSPWGHGVGCDFVNGPCLAGGGNGYDGSIPSTSKGFFCNKASSRGCSPAYTHKMACTVIDYSLRNQYLPPQQFQYFSDAAIGGPREADYCPVYGSVYSGMKPADLDCRISGNGDSIDIIYSEEYGDNSMCFDTTSGEGRCYKAQCIYDEFNLKLQVDGKWYTCEEDFQQLEVSTLSGAFGTTVTCPRLSSVCPDMFCPVNCAGRGKCVFDHVNSTDSKPRPLCECFDETDKSAGCSDTFVLDGKYLRDGTSLRDTLKTNFFDPLIATFVDHPDTWTTASWAWAAALFVVFLLMILCICSSFWPEKQKTKKRSGNRNRYAV